MNTENRRQSGITIKSRREIKLMLEAGRIIAEVKRKLAAAAAPGIETRDLDLMAEKEIRQNGAIPSFKGYQAGAIVPFPATICASINDEIVHGIPGKRKLKEGDIISIDVGAIYHGLHADSAFTVGIGQVTDEAQRLIDATRQALAAGISKIKAGARIGDISSAVQMYAEKLGYGVVRQYVGHGIGFEMHEPPQVPNYGPAGHGPLIREGMALAIEPMLTIGGWQTKQLDDGWTVSTADGTLSAHFEDTIIITPDGPTITTKQAVM